MRFPATMSLHGARVLLASLAAEKESIHDGTHPVQDGPEYSAMMLESIDTELKHLAIFFRQLGLDDDADRVELIYYE